MVTIKVGKGDQQAEFSIHKDLICKASPFFNAACKPERMKAEDRVIELPEDEPDVIQIMVYWIYHDVISITEDMEANNGIHGTVEKALKTPWGIFAQLYVVGRKYQMARLQNDTIDAILYHCKDYYLPTSLIPWVYEHTIKEDNLRTLVFRLSMHVMGRDDMALYGNFFSQEFLFDMTYALLEDDGETINSNESLIESDDVHEDFCSQLHNQDACDGNCEEYKEYIVIDDEELE